MLTVSSNLLPGTVAQIVKNLRYVSSESFLRGLALRQKAEEVLQTLRLNFPQSNDPKSSSVKEFGIHLADGFYIDEYVSRTMIGFKIRHTLERRKRAKTVLASLDLGSRAYTFTPKKDIHFEAAAASGYTGWKTLYAGEEYKHDARPGVHYTGKTEAYIENVILPRLGAEITTKIDSRMKRL